MKKLLVHMTFVMLSARLFAAQVTVDATSKRLLVDGEPFSVKGVNYSPTPPNERPGPPSNYDLFSDLPLLAIDFPLIKQMGANTIRVFDGRQATAAALDAAWANGLYVIMGFAINTSSDVTNAGTRASIQAEFLTMVNAFKSHPAVLMWCFGNEVRVSNGSAAANGASWYTLVDSCAAAAHAADPAHPVTTSVADLGDIGDIAMGTDGNNPANLDIWSVNFYRGASFGTAFSDFAAESDKPLLITEFGMDVYNTAAAGEDQGAQAAVVAGLAREIEDQLSASSPGAGTVGGCVFAWSDEWWKGRNAVLGDGGAGGDGVQDTAADFTNGAYADTGQQEEWWGLAAVSAASVSRRPRSSYYALKSLWSAPAATVFGDLLQGPVRNYPNPVMRGGITSIRFTLSGVLEGADVAIFDGAYRRLRSLRTADSLGNGQYAVQWDGRNQDGNPVEPGVYLARVEVRSSGRAQVKYFHLAVLE